MKKIFNLTLISILTISALKSEARNFSVEEVRINISQAVIEDCKKYTDAEVNPKILAIPFPSLALPDGKISFEVASSQDKFLPRDIKKVTAFVDGKPVKTFSVPVEIKAYKNVLVASDYIDRDKFLAKSCVCSKKMEVSNNLEYILTSNMLEKEIIAKKIFKEGEVIDKRFVKLKPDIERNSEVTAFFNSDNLMISIDATALSEGMLGDYIEVQNKNYRKTYTGKIIGENKVLIRL